MRPISYIAVLFLITLPSQAQHYINPPFRVSYYFNDLQDSVASWLYLNREDPVTGRLNSLTLYYDAEIANWTFLSRAELTRGTEGYDSCSVTHVWDGQVNDWELEGKYYWTVDGQGRSIQEIYIEWDPEIPEWKESWKLERTFNQDGSLAGYHRYMQTDVSIGLVDYDSTAFFYDSRGNDTLKIYLRWDESGEAVQTHNKFERSFDTEDRLILEISDRMKPGSLEWAHEAKDEFYHETIADSATIVEKVRYLWDEDLEEWVFHLADKSLKTVKVDGTWMEIGYNNPLWETDPEKWNPAYKLELNTDHKDNIILESIYYWDPETENFIISNRYYQSWDALVSFDADTICHGDSVHWNNNYLKSRGIYLDGDPSFVWPQNFQCYYLAVHPDPVSFLLTGEINVHEQEAFEYMGADYPDGIYSWEVANGDILSHPSANSAEVRWGTEGWGTISAVVEDLEGCRTDTAVLEVQIRLVGMEGFSSEPVRVYPNPVSGVLKVESEKEVLTEVYDMQGRLLHSTSSRMIDFSPMQRGTYLLRIRTREGELIGSLKVLKE